MQVNRPCPSEEPSTPYGLSGLTYRIPHPFALWKSRDDNSFDDATLVGDKKNRKSLGYARDDKGRRALPPKTRDPQLRVEPKLLLEGKELSAAF